jgi:glycosyltransferase involved in cell wall biosynthesis
MKRFRRGLSLSRKVYAISPAMRDEYKKLFSLPNVGITANCVPVRPYTPTASAQVGLRLLYAGNLGINRWKVLASLAEALRVLRAEGKMATLSVYSLADPGEKIRRALHVEGVSSFRGSLTQAQVNEAIAQSDALVHVEAFDRGSRQVTRLSLSTKIPEYMMAGRCIVAIGPADVSSIAYLRDLNAAVVMTDPSVGEMADILRASLFCEAARETCRENAYKAAVERHDAVKLRAMLRKDVCDV